MGLGLDEKKRELIRERSFCSFNDYVAQLCNTYLKYEHAGRDGGVVLQPYKFWTLNKEEHMQLNNIISTSDVKLTQFPALGTLPEWVLKRCLLFDCDLLNNLIAYFDVDPAVGASLMETIVYSSFSDKYVYNDFKNISMTLVEN